MANVDRPRGLEPWGELRRASEWEAGGVIGIGDAVKQDAAGQVVVVANVGSVHTGAIIGVALQSADTAGDKILVADDPDQQFRIQADGSDIDAQTDIGLNYSILGTDRDSNTKESRQELDSSSGATTATLPLKLVSISKAEGNALGAQVDCVVVVNNHQLKGGTGTQGV